MNDTRPDLDALRDQFAEMLRDDIYACTRSWEAWQVGTMTADDFTPAWEDEDVIDNLVQVAAAALAAERARADQAEAKLAAIAPLFAFGTFGNGLIDEASHEQLIAICNKAADRSDKVREILSAAPTAEQAT